jgi:hypothetical protein
MVIGTFLAIGSGFRIFLPGPDSGSAIRYHPDTFSQREPTREELQPAWEPPEAAVSAERSQLCLFYEHDSHYGLLRGNYGKVLRLAYG